MREIVLLVLLNLVCLASWAQLNRKTTDEIGLGLTIMSAYTDIGGTKGAGEGLVDFSLSAQRPSFHGFYKRNFSNKFSFRANVLVGWLAQKDVDSRNERRGFACNTPMIETSANGIYYIVAEKEPFFYDPRSKGSRGWSHNVYPSLYVRGGLGVAFYAPIPNQKLSEAEDAGYEGGKVLAPIFPLGLGTTIPIFRDVRFVFDLTYVFSLTDYLDGYSNPKYSKSKDMYFTLNLGLSYQIGSPKVQWKPSKK